MNTACMSDSALTKIVLQDGLGWKVEPIETEFGIRYWWSAEEFPPNFGNFTFRDKESVEEYAPNLAIDLNYLMWAALKLQLKYNFILQISKDGNVFHRITIYDTTMYSYVHYITSALNFPRTLLEACVQVIERKKVQSEEDGI